MSNQAQPQQALSTSQHEPPAIGYFPLLRDRHRGGGEQSQRTYECKEED